MVGFVSPPDFDFGYSLVMLSVIIIGGVDSIAGRRAGGVPPAAAPGALPLPPRVPAAALRRGDRPDAPLPAAGSLAGAVRRYRWRPSRSSGRGHVGPAGNLAHTRPRRQGRARQPAPLRDGRRMRLVTRGLTVRFGGLEALAGVDVAVAPGETVGVIGPERLREDHALQRHQRPLPGGGGRDPLRGAAADRAGAPRDRPARRRADLPDEPALPWPVRLRQRAGRHARPAPDGARRRGAAPPAAPRRGARGPRRGLPAPRLFSPALRGPRLRPGRSAPADRPPPGRDLPRARAPPAAPPARRALGRDEPGGDGRADEGSPDRAGGGARPVARDHRARHVRDRGREPARRGVQLRAQDRRGDLRRGGGAPRRCGRPIWARRAGVGEPGAPVDRIGGIPAGRRACSRPGRSRPATDR